MAGVYHIVQFLNVRKLEEHILAIELTVQVPEKKLRTPIFYKYYVTQYGQGQNDNCYEFLEHFQGGIINRVLLQNKHHFVDNEGMFTVDLTLILSCNVQLGIQ